MSVVHTRSRRPDLRVGAAMLVPKTFVDRPYAAKHFRAITEYARTRNPFYQRWIADLEHVPIIDRNTFLDHNDEILNGFPVTAKTSGSTGIPVRVSQSHERQRICTESGERFVSWLGGPLPCTRIIYPPSDVRPEWLLDVQTPLDGQIEFIQSRHREAGAVALTTYPTNAEMLAQEVLLRGIDMSFVQRFGVYAEVFESHQEEIIRRAFPNAQVWTTYSSMEFDMIAARCPHEPRFHHIMADKLGVEILRDDGEPCLEGEMGRVVITDYFNRQSPLIRYEIGDYAVPGTCPCNRIKLPSVGRIVGKVRGTLLHRSGQRMIFTDLSVRLRDIPGMRQYQVVQDSVEDFTVKIVASRSLDNEVRQVFQDHFGYLPRNLRTQYVDVIDRGPGGKFHAAICNVPHRSDPVK